MTTRQKILNEFALCHKIEKQCAEQLLKHCNWNVSEAAECLRLVDIGQNSAPQSNGASRLMPVTQKNSVNNNSPISASSKFPAELSSSPIRSGTTSPKYKVTVRNEMIGGTTTVSVPTRQTNVNTLNRFEKLPAITSSQKADTVQTLYSSNLVASKHECSNMPLNKVAISTKAGGGKPAHSNFNHDIVHDRSGVTGPEGRVLKRGISKTAENLTLVSYERDKVLSDIREDSNERIQYLDTPTPMFILPDLSLYQDDFRAFLERDLIDLYTMNALQKTAVLNWWYDLQICRKLWPMATSGDGNCLLHAASLAMWSFHDRDLILRNALFHSMTASTFHGALFRRWRFQQMQLNKQSGLIYSETEWNEEWENLLHLASSEPRCTEPCPQQTVDTYGNSSFYTHDHKVNGSNPTYNQTTSVTYESLEEFHVFVLAHVIRRPIIVIADRFLRDTNGDPLAPIPFAGVYLPLECRPERCHRTPLLLSYDAAHFSALVLSEGVDESLPAAVPLVSSDYTLLPFHFHIDPGDHYDWCRLEKLDVPDVDLTMYEKMSLLQVYLDISILSIPLPVTDIDSVQYKTSSSDDAINVGTKERRRMQQQVHTVAKQFGSIGKCMSKKLRNIGSKTTCMKANTNDMEPSTSAKATTSGVLTRDQSRLTSMVIVDEYHIPCSSLTNHRSQLSEQMVRNYLVEAKDRFELDQEMNNKDGQSQTYSYKVSPTRCMTERCTMYGSADTNYLCSDCYSRSRKQAAEDELSNYVHKEGKSVFYTDEKFNTLPHVDGRVTMNSNYSSRASNTLPKKLSDLPPVDTNLLTNNYDSRGNVRDRQASPGSYDNIDAAVYPSAERMSRIHRADPVQCLTAGCTFYGSIDNEYYCSKCYRERMVRFGNSFSSL